MTGLEVVLPALLPVAIDGVRGLINRFTGGAAAKPSNPQEVIQLMEAETNRLRALADIEGKGETYRWVEAVRKLQRPVLGILAVLGYFIAIHTDVPEITVAGIGQWVQMYSFYLFGDRTYMYLKQN